MLNMYPLTAEAYMRNAGETVKARRTIKTEESEKRFRQKRNDDSRKAKAAIIDGKRNE
jgi:hypothetical protein